MPRGLILLMAIATATAQPPLTFLGRKVTLTTPEIDNDGGIFPKGPASVCLEGQPRQCYTMPSDHGGNVGLTVVQIDAKTPALLFSAWSGGVSGFGIHMALLRPGFQNQLDNLFMKSIELSEQGRHAFLDGCFNLRSQDFRDG